VADVSGGPELVPEPFDRLLIEGDLGLDQLQGYFLFELCVLDPVDFTHPSFAQFFDDFIPSCKGDSSSKFISGSFSGFRDFDPPWGGELRPALPTEFQGVQILRMTFRALGGHLSSLLSGVAKGYQGMGGLVN